MDTGPIFTQESITIDPSWRSVELLKHLADLGPGVVQRAFEMVESGKSAYAQDGASSLAPKISKAEAKIDFATSASTSPAERVDSIVISRALSETPMRISARSMLFKEAADFFAVVIFLPYLSVFDLAESLN